MPDYQHLTYDELLNLGQERNQLTEEARVVFDAELVQRKLSHAEIQSYARQTLAQEFAEMRRKERSRFFYENRSKHFFGKKDRLFDDRKRIEEFDTTLWFTIGIPIVPLYSCRIRRLYRN